MALVGGGYSKCNLSTLPVIPQLAWRQTIDRRLVHNNTQLWENQWMLVQHASMWSLRSNVCGFHMYYWLGYYSLLFHFDGLQYLIVTHWHRQVTSQVQVLMAWRSIGHLTKRHAKHFDGRSCNAEICHELQGNIGCFLGLQVEQTMRWINVLFQSSTWQYENTFLRISKFSLSINRITCFGGGYLQWMASRASR